jgi:transcriptional antiterminator RfaH
MSTESSARWFVVRTKVRQEHVARDNLERQGFDLYLPTIRAARRRAGRWCAVVEPLFPGYLFVHADAQRRSLAPIASTRGALGLVRFGGELSTVPDTVIDGITTLQPDREAPVEPAHLFNRGDKVSLVDGPFTGLEAIFEARSGKERVVVLLDLLGRPNRVAVGIDQVVPACR